MRSPLSLKIGQEKSKEILLKCRGIQELGHWPELLLRVL